MQRTWLVRIIYASGIHGDHYVYVGDTVDYMVTGDFQYPTDAVDYVAGKHARGRSFITWEVTEVTA